MGLGQKISTGLRRLAREQRGMTLAELLSAQLVAGVVLAAAGTLVIISLRSEQRISDKVSSVSQGRIVAAQIETRLNSQLCLYTGEYAINGATASTAAASILNATPSNLIYFADISERGSGATNGVGFQPFLRYLLSPTPGTGRKGGFIDAYRAPSNNSIPFNFSITPASSLSDLASGNASTTVPPTSILRAVGTGVTNAVSATDGTSIPFFQYWDADNLGPTGTPIAMVAGAVPDDQLSTIARIRINYRLLAESGNDQAAQSTATKKIDDRTESFTSDIYLRTTPDICDQLSNR